MTKDVPRLADIRGNGHGDFSIAARVADVQTRIAALHNRFAVPVEISRTPSAIRRVV